MAPAFCKCRFLANVGVAGLRQSFPASSSCDCTNAKKHESKRRWLWNDSCSCKMKIVEGKNFVTRVKKLHGMMGKFKILSSNRDSQLPGSANLNVGSGRVASVQPMLGDANDDGLLENLDISFFASSLLNRPLYEIRFPNLDPDVVLDMNDHGVFNNLYTAGFGAVLGF